MISLESSSRIHRLKAIGIELFYDEYSNSFSLSENDFGSKKEEPKINDLLEYIKPSSFYFCIEPSNACNLKCSYCFNNSKDGKALSQSKAIDQLNYLFGLFPNGEKYYVDLSGKGEPLLNLKTILAISDYCIEKSNQIKREVIPMFVCNGTLLSPKIAKLLQDHQVLFGVSLDGNKKIHDRNRKSKAGQPTYDLIVRNIDAIKNKQYIGCATTLTRDVFNLKKSVFTLSKTFNTLSYRIVRSCTIGLNKKAVKHWKKEYNKLAKALLNEAKKGNLKQWFCLLNGDDYFGRFLCRAISKSKTINRCDGGISRFAIDEGNKVYPCSAATCVSDLEIEKNIKGYSKEELTKQAYSCAKCIYKRHCGGECQIEIARLKRENDCTCELTKHLIILSQAISLTLEKENKREFDTLLKFVKEKYKRNRMDDGLRNYVAKYHDLTFSEVRKRYNEEKKQ